MKEIFRCEKCDKEFSTAEEAKRHEGKCEVFCLWAVVGGVGHHHSLWSTEQMAEEHSDRKYTSVEKVYVNRERCREIHNQNI